MFLINFDFALPRSRRISWYESLHLISEWSWWLITIWCSIHGEKYANVKVEYARDDEIAQEPKLEAWLVQHFEDWFDALIEATTSRLDRCYR